MICLCDKNKGAASPTPLPPRPQNNDHETDHNNRTTNTDSTHSSTTTSCRSMEVFGNCPRLLRFCPECPRSTETLGVLQKDKEPVKEEFFWMKTVQCPQCSVGWHICLLCTGLRSHMRNRSTFRTHYRGSTTKRLKNRGKKGNSVSGTF
jgi:hypothetical protein